MQRAPHKVWFVTFPDAELLDLSGPWAVLTHANDLSGHCVYAPALVSPFGGDLGMRHGPPLARSQALRELARKGLPDTLIVAGGSAETVLPAAEAKLSSWLRVHGRRIPRLISVCKGAFVLAHAGLLNGKRVTTHWRFAPELRERFPKLQVVERDIFVRDGRIWTSAGITAGIDLTLALVEHDHGADLSMAIARNLVLFLRRSGHQAQFSQVLTRQANEPPRARSLAAVVLEHIDRDLSVEQLARRLGMSPRSLTRFCRSELDESPASIVRRMRLEEARRLLTETKLPLKDLARRTGIGDASTLWRIFTRELGVTPADYRQRFTRQLA